MEVITIESKAFKNIIERLEKISRYVKEHSESDHEGWVDSHDVCTYLKISIRTLQRLRAQKLLNYSIIRGKSYYKLSEIQRMLDENLIKGNPQNFQDLLANYYKNAK
ncbi:transcriptional regulator [Bacteroidia bacterium]|nr:transcriptional regulator [Bacteroidia bacterium]